MFRRIVLEEFTPFGELSPQQLDQLEGHYELLKRWNKTLNLTRIEDEGGAARFHYCESLFLGDRLPKGPLVVADLGSGGGFPGIPVAVLRPDLEVILIEAHQRKAVFLREAVRGMKNVEVVNARVEHWHGRADWVIARAVSAHAVLKAKIAPRFALLLSAQDAPNDSQVIESPWGSERIIAVSREISST